MNKTIQLFYLFLNLFIFSSVTAQDNTKTVQLANGYYQTIDLNPNTSCDCNAKTERTLQLNKALAPKDVLNYKLHAYKFSLGNNSNMMAKLFKAMEKDLSIYKVSMKEWTAFMVLTTDEFDATSFEQAAKSVFTTLEAMPVKDFLQSKNIDSYNELVQKEMRDQQKQVEQK